MCAYVRRKGLKTRREYDKKGGLERTLEGVTTKKNASSSTGGGVEVGHVTEGGGAGADLESPGGEVGPERGRRITS